MAAKKDTVTFSDNSERKTITLQQAIIRGNTEITDIQVRKPKAGELRGLSLGELMNSDVNTLRELLPRITAPAITVVEIDDLDPADLVQLSTSTLAFFVPKGDKEQEGKKSNTLTA